MGGRDSSGAGLGLNAPLRFGVLMENCGRAEPTAATVAAREARTRPDRGERKSSERGRDEQPRGNRTLTHSHFCERVSQTKEEKKTVNNKELDQLRQNSGEVLQVILSSSWNI